MTGKKILRAEARRRRATLVHPDFARRLASHADALGIEAGTLIGGYAALEGEADPCLLLEVLASRGCSVTFPRVAMKDEALVFHHWTPGRELSKGRFGIAEPLPDWPIARPETLLVPLLAFDARGHRLGYGGGYYDRTIAALKAHGPLRTIGIAYAGQEVLSLPHDPHDQPLDAVLTENGLRSFNPES